MVQPVPPTVVIGADYFVLVPWVVWGFFKLITPFIDPLTRDKLKFNEDMRQYVPEEQLWTEFNGTLEFDYDHSVYWPALSKLCAERHEARKQRWVAGGGHIGESEDYLNGHTETGLGGALPPATAEQSAPAADEVTLVAQPDSRPQRSRMAPLRRLWQQRRRNWPSQRIYQQQWSRLMAPGPYRPQSLPRRRVGFAEHLALVQKA